MTPMTQTRTIEVGMKMSLPAILLRVEGLTVLLGAIALYANQGGSWLMFVLLLLVPDVSAVGYLANPRIGSYIYSIVHTYTLPALLMALALAGQWPLGVQLALIWFAHIGMDRTVGYGLKYATELKGTHLQRV